MAAATRLSTAATAAPAAAPAPRRLSHGMALAGMLLVTLLWSSAGVVSRQLESARGFETTFWRSLACVVPLVLWMLATQGRGAFATTLRQGGKALWISGLCWATMFTCFMVAITLTTVANVLITMSLAPFMTALLGRVVNGTRVPLRTWVAIVLAGVGIAWMYVEGLSTEGRHLVGTLVALGVPIAAAVNWVLLQRIRAEVDLVPAILVGGILSCLLTLPLAWPLQAPVGDVAWLAGLGVFQLAVPCALAVVLARHLPAAEMSLLAQLEIVFGIAWAWLFAGEEPARAVLLGGGLVLVVLVVNQGLALREASRPAEPSA
jgi:drug/metabolite transporter (DMT)-like permease